MLRYHREWVESVQKVLPENVSLHQVDAHNIVPVWEASDKQEYGARTIRLVHCFYSKSVYEWPKIISIPVSQCFGPISTCTCGVDENRYI